MKELGSQFWRFVSKPMSKFLSEGILGGVLLLAATIIAFMWANSPWGGGYDELMHIPVVVSIGSTIVDNTIAHWINDGLMAIFFFVVGLEIKRELLVGELSEFRKALLPAVGALGGMIVPALIYFVFNSGGDYTAGWGIPMATDIAFALGVLVVLGNRVPLSLKVFLLALAIFDDMGAIVVIAIFYTEQISALNLEIAIIILAVSLFLNAKGVRKTMPYAVLGLALWMALLDSGIHATVAGVLLAFTIPARSKYDQEYFKDEARGLISKFPERPFDVMVVDEEQREFMKRIQCTVEGLDTPLQKMEDSLHDFSNYLIIPLFALANAGVNILGGADISLLHPVSLGIIAGLVIGKPLGIITFVLLSARLGITKLPEGVTRRQIIGIGCLGGIGFTMSLFVTNLAFTDTAAIDQAKIAILLASMVSAVLGSALLVRAGRQ